MAHGSWLQLLIRIRAMLWALPGLAATSATLK
jgi:hypothetical protein